MVLVSGANRSCGLCVTPERSPGLENLPTASRKWLKLQVWENCPFKSGIRVIDGGSVISSPPPTYLQQSSNETHMPGRPRRCELVDRKMTLTLEFPSTPHAAFSFFSPPHRTASGLEGQEGVGGRRKRVGGGGPTCPTHPM